MGGIIYRVMAPPPWGKGTPFNKVGVIYLFIFYTRIFISFIAKARTPPVPKNGVRQSLEWAPPQGGLASRSWGKTTLIPLSFLKVRAQKVVVFILLFITLLRGVTGGNKAYT